MSRARNIGRRAAAGARGTLIGAASGAAAFFAHKAASDRIDFVRDNWWVGPAVLAVGGHMLKQKPRTATIGVALVGAAGYAGGLGYSMNRAVKQQAEAQGLQSGGGYYETQGLQTPGDPYALSDNAATDAAPLTSAWAPQDAELSQQDSIAGAMML